MLTEAIFEPDLDIVKGCGRIMAVGAALLGLGSGIGGGGGG